MESLKLSDWSSENTIMSKTRIAAWIAGSALLLSSGVALAETAPDDPAVVDDVVDVAGVDELDDGTVADVEEADVEEADVEEESTEEGDESHGSVVSMAAHNHEFDEACGNHGAYVSEVAKGGDPDDPECAKDDEEAATEVVASETSDGEDDAAVEDTEEVEPVKAKKASKARSTKASAKGKHSK